MRVFDSGATRDDAEDKIDPEGFFSPQVMARRADYMHKHRHMKDGSTRDSDNWQKGIPRDALAKSLIRHVLDFWLQHRGYPAHSQDTEGMEETLCAIMFNAEALLKQALDFRALPPLRPPMQDLTKPKTLLDHTTSGLCWCGFNYDRGNQ